MNNINLLKSLKDNDSIVVNLTASNWKEAVKLATDPLVKSGAVTKNYYKKIIKNTEDFGPYYIIADGLAMPHGRPEDGVLKDAFSLITLTQPIKFKGDNREIRVLMSLGATSSDMHVSSALPQVVALFEVEERITQIMNAQNKEEIIKIIEKVDFSKFLGGNR